MTKALAYDKTYAFNAICPYYTMFPLEYPLHIIRKHKADAPVILDPFCGRGTTIYAARKLGLKSYGFDTSPIAAAIARAKLASASLEDVIALAEKLITKPPKQIPETAFFKRAFSKATLRELCSLREGLLAEKNPSDASAILRAAALGCLHGPMIKGHGSPSYFSNQMPRTFSSKPDYSVRFWKERDLFPPKVSVMDVIKKKLERISDLDSDAHGRTLNVRCSDARKAKTFAGIPDAALTITSPPYYGMRTYVQDQWLRMWFMGGADEIDYDSPAQLCHTGHDAFIADLAKVWKNVHKHSIEGAHLYVRFGTLPSAKSDAKYLLKSSLEEAEGWDLVSVRNAQTADAGKRQADQMGMESEPSEEYDFHAILN
jgi:hypothetical protein